jgi:cysteine-rich repeat protein
MRRWFLAAAIVVGCATGGPVVDATSTSGGASSGGTGAVDPVGGGGAGLGGSGGGTSATCGDGVVDPGEECDDGNTIDGDGCSGCLIDCEPMAVKNPANHHCYRVFTTAATWATAEPSCQTWGGAPGLGHLVSIADAAEQTFVSALVSEGAWIGADDAANEGVYVWTDGTPWMYQHFAPGEPNDTNHTENCIYMHADGGWDDHDCAYMWPSYVCERRGAGTF